MVDRKLRSIDQVNPLIEYLDKNLKKGYKLDDLKWALINQGNSRVAVDKAVEVVMKKRAPEPVKVLEKPKEEYVDMTQEPKQEEKSLWQKIKAFFS
jgi:hypothetical protein